MESVAKIEITHVMQDGIPRRYRCGPSSACAKWALGTVGERYELHDGVGDGAIVGSDASIALMGISAQALLVAAARRAPVKAQRRARVAPAPTRAPIAAPSAPAQARVEAAVAPPAAVSIESVAPSVTAPAWLRW